MKKLMIVLLLLLLPVRAQAVDEETSLKIRNLIDDYLACHVYSKIVERGLQNGNDTAKATAEIYNLGAEAFLFRAHTLGQGINMKEETLLAKVELELKDQLDSIDNNAINISILMNKYAYSCQHLHDNTEEVLKERGLDYN